MAIWRNNQDYKKKKKGGGVVQGEQVMEAGTCGLPWREATQASTLNARAG